MDTSPLKQLAIIWQTADRPKNQSEINAARARLYTAAVHEITFKASASIPFDPLQSPLFKWACQRLDQWEGTRKTIDPEIEFHLRLALDPVPLSKKLLSAGSLD
jgi:hypothetical protein